MFLAANFPSLQPKGSQKEADKHEFLGVFDVFLK